MGEKLTKLPEDAIVDQPKGEIGKLEGVTVVPEPEEQGSEGEASDSKMGRPSEYTDELALEIVARIIEGDSLRKICRDDDMPSLRTVMYWLSKGDKGEKPYDEFLQQYTRAKTESADSNADRIEEIAEDVMDNKVDPQAARVAIDAYKWSSGRKKPKKYGDKLDLTGEQTHIHKFKDLTDEQLDATLESVIARTEN